MLDTKIFISLAITVLLMVGLQYIVHKTKIGKSMRAASLDREAAQLMGVDVDKTISFTFAIGSALAGLLEYLLEFTIIPLIP